LLAATTRQSTGTSAVGAQALHHTLLQHAQQLDLHRQRHALDLVEEQRAAVRRFELAGACLLRPGEGARLVAEEFVLHQRVGQAATVDGHEGAGLARAEVVQAARHEFLAGAGLAVDQHVRGGGGQRQARCGRSACIGASAPPSALDATLRSQLFAQCPHLQHQAAFSAARCTTATMRSEEAGFSMKS
jgi:hypothetical protein